MNITTLELTYDYSPYRSQEDQETIVALFAASPRLLRVLEAAQCKAWVHNVALTDDIEALRSICLHYGR